MPQHIETIMLFKVHYTIKRDGTEEQGSRIIGASSAIEAGNAVRANATAGTTMVIRKVKVHRA